MRPPPALSLSDWAERYAYLSPETSSESGKFKAFAYQNGIMDAVTNPDVERITVMKSARIGYTKVLDHICGYFVHQDPSPVLIVQPRVEDAQDYSRSEIMPMLRDTPALKVLVGEVKAHDPNQRILKRMFPNGASRSAASPRGSSCLTRLTAIRSRAPEKRATRSRWRRRARRRSGTARSCLARPRPSRA